MPVDGPRTKPAQVAEQLVQLGQVCEELQKAITELDDRLSPIVTNEPEEQKDKPDAPGLVPLAHNLWEKNAHLREQVAFLIELRHRIEL